MSSTVKQKDPQHDSKKKKLPEKVFLARNSMLTEMYETKHFMTIYHIFALMLGAFLLTTMLDDWATEGKINIGLDVVATTFEGLHYGFGIWIVMQLLTLVVYPVFVFWAKSTQTFFVGPVGKYSKFADFWNKSWAIVVVVYEVSFMINFTKILMQYPIMPGVSLAVLLEMLRFIMKSYAFIRTNVPRVLYTQKPDNSTIIPTFKMFIYFMFAPTMIYRDDYPRTNQIRWSFVMKRAAEVIFGILLLGFVFQKNFVSKFGEYGGKIKEVNAIELISYLSGRMFIGLFCMVLSFYMTLHSWMNCAAELLRFGDRLFYKDWWNSTSYDEYYRTWNIVVHDWLYNYVYKDAYEYISKNKVVCQLIVFMLSAIVHEYVCIYMLRIFFPFMFFSFGIVGVSLVFATRKENRAIGNLAMWLTLSYGNGLMLSLYNVEYYARRNCPGDMAEWWEPMFLKCISFKFN